mmetsp:Transcript_24726/g.68348  ORF Transcript_24726/g.68348 Transcript_24726/m.68348 type:complete len:219 (+) Transcript_24726:300-956(+)
MRSGQIIQEQDVSLGPAIEHHVFVNGTSNFSSVIRSDWFSIPKLGGERHLVTQHTVFHHVKGIDKQKEEKEANVFAALESKPYLSRERCPMKDLNVIRPSQFLGDGVELKGLSFCGAHKGITFPFNGSAFLFANAFDLLLVIGHKNVGPSNHVGNIKREVGSVLMIGSNILNALVDQLLTQFGVQISGHTPKIGNGRFSSNGFGCLQTTKKELDGGAG